LIDGKSGDDLIKLAKEGAKLEDAND